MPVFNSGKEHALDKDKIMRVPKLYCPIIMMGLQMHCKFLANTDSQTDEQNRDLCIRRCESNSLKFVIYNQLFSDFV